MVELGPGPPCYRRESLQQVSICSVPQQFRNQTESEISGLESIYNPPRVVKPLAARFLYPIIAVNLQQILRVKRQKRCSKRLRRSGSFPRSMLFAQFASQSSPIVPTGIGLGSVIAVLCSWERNRSIIWAIIAAFLSWIYVIYFALTRRAN